MASSEPLWAVENALGERTYCFLNLVGDGYRLLVKRENEVLVSEQHDVPRTGIDRAAAIYRQLVEAGWSPVADESS